jgi:hypothetical protein
LPTYRMPGFRALADGYGASSDDPVEIFEAAANASEADGVLLPMELLHDDAAAAGSGDNSGGSGEDDAEDLEVLLRLPEM